MSLFSNGNTDRNSTSTLRDNVRQFTQRTSQIQSNTKDAIRRLPGVLTEPQINRLRKHTYASEGITLLDPYMQKFWKWLVEFCPLWVAPNLLTIIGLVLNIGTSVLLMIFTNGAKEQVNSFVFFMLKNNI
jgi:choline/ethanolamine phosphotransferase